MSRIILETKERVGYFGRIFLIVPDNAAGRRARRYTVYRIPGSPSRKVEVIGRELPLKLARQCAKNYKR